MKRSGEISTSNTPLLEFTTADPDEFAENMSGLAPSLKCDAQLARKPTMKVCGAQLPGLGLFESTLDNFCVQSEERPFYAITIPVSGHCDIQVQGKQNRFHQNRIHIQHPDREFIASVTECSVHSLQLCFDTSIINRMASALGDGQLGTLREVLNLNNSAAQSFSRHAFFIWSELKRGGTASSSPLIAQESADLLAALLIEASVSPARTLNSHPDHTAVRKAEEYIMGHLLLPISTADIVEASGASARTLSREFRRHQGTTLKGFIKLRRLEAANRALISADAGQHNVTQIALEHGFDQLGRFSSDYKQLFGELPSQTLYNQR